MKVSLNERIKRVLSALLTAAIFATCIPNMNVMAASKREVMASIAYGELGQRQGSKYSGCNAAWCAYFAQWCARRAGLGSSQWPNTGSTNALIAWFDANGRWHNRTDIEWSYRTCYGFSEGNGMDDGYIPRPGDFAAIDNNGNISDAPEHTAVVFSVNRSGGYIQTVEGNIGGRVVTCKYDINTLRLLSGPASSRSIIVGFGSPDYGVEDDQPSDGDYVTFTSVINSNMAVDVAQGLAMPGSNIWLWESNGSAAQVFKLQKAYGKWFYIRSSIDEDLYMDVQDEMTNVQLCYNTGSKAQLWKFEQCSDGTYMIRNALGKYLDIYSGSAMRGQNIWVYTGNGSEAQRYYIDKIR